MLVKGSPVRLPEPGNILLSLPSIGAEEGAAQGCGWDPGANCSQQARGAQVGRGIRAPFPNSQSVRPSGCSASGSTGKAPLGPSSHRPSHGLTFVLSNRSDQLPASMAVFKVHLRGTEAECSGKPRRGAVCVPGLPGPGLGSGAASHWCAG